MSDEATRIRHFRVRIASAEVVDGQTLRLRRGAQLRQRHRRLAVTDTGCRGKRRRGQGCTHGTILLAASHIAICVDVGVEAIPRSTVRPCHLEGSVMLMTYVKVVTHRQMEGELPPAPTWQPPAPVGFA